MLAEKYYNMPGMADKILGSLQNPQQTHQEGGLLACLESGQVDAAAGYESEVRSDHLPYVALPDEINLRNPSMAKRWYDTVSPLRTAKARIGCSTLNSGKDVYGIC